jgi:hypothetical protein
MIDQADYVLNSQLPKEDFDRMKIEYLEPNFLEPKGTYLRVTLLIKSKITIIMVFTIVFSKVLNLLSFFLIN